MFDPSEEEMRRNEALQHAIFSSDNVSPHHPSYEDLTEKILKRAQEFETFLKEGKKTLTIENGPPDVVTHRLSGRQSVQDAYLERGLDGGTD